MNEVKVVKVPPGVKAWLDEVQAMDVLVEREGCETRKVKYAGGKPLLSQLLEETKKDPEARDGIRVYAPGWMDHPRPLAEAATMLYGMGCTLDFHGGYGIPLQSRLPGLVRKGVTIPRMYRHDQKVQEVMFERLVENLRNPMVNLAYVDGRKLVVIISQEKGWLKPYTGLGCKVQMGEKTVKRLKPLGVPTIIQGELEEDLRVRVYAGEKEQHDGAFFMSRSLFRKLAGQCRARFEEHMLAAGGDDLDKLGRAFKSFLKKATRCKVFITRVQMKEGAQLKGACVVVHDKMLGGYDLVTHQANIKEEVSGFSRWVFSMEPYPGKEEARTNLQFHINHSWLFSEEWSKRAATRMVQDVVQRITTGEDTRRLLRAGAAEAELAEGKESHDRRMRSAADRFMGLGHTLNESPFLAESVYNALTHQMLSVRRGKINLPIDCARYCQVLSSELLREGGFKCRPAKGYIKYLRKWGFAVVHPDAWATMVRDHQGCDQDDKFTLVYRKDKATGRKVVVVLRSPNDWGEYSIFLPHGEEDCPASVGFAGGKEIKYRWPAADLSGAPAQFHTVEDKLQVVGPEPGVVQREESYTVDTVVRHLHRAIKNPSPGGVINHVMLWNSTMKTFRPEFISMEKVIDLPVQTDDEASMEWMEGYAKDLLVGVLRAGKEVDRFLWESRNFRVPRGCSNPETCEGPLTRLADHIEKAREAGRVLVKKWAHQDHKVPKAVKEVEWHGQLGAEEKGIRAIVGKYRSQVAQLMQAQEQESLPAKVEARAEAEGCSVDTILKRIVTKYRLLRRDHAEDLKGWLVSRKDGKVRVGKLAWVLHHVTQVKPDRDLKVPALNDGVLFGKTFLELYLEFLGESKK